MTPYFTQTAWHAANMYIKSMSPSTIHNLVYNEGRVWTLRPSAHQSPPLPTVLERWGTMGAMGGIMGQTSVQQYTRMLQLDQMMILKPPASTNTPTKSSLSAQLHKISWKHCNPVDNSNKTWISEFEKVKKENCLWNACPRVRGGVVSSCRTAWWGIAGDNATTTSRKAHKPCALMHCGEGRSRPPKLQMKTLVCTLSIAQGHCF